MFGPVSARQTVIDGNTAMFGLMRLHNATKFFYRVTEQNSAYSRIRIPCGLYVSCPSYLDAPLLARLKDGIAARFYSRFLPEKREIFYGFFSFLKCFHSREHTPFGGDVKTFAIDMSSNTRHFRVSRPTIHVRNGFFRFRRPISVSNTSY